MGGAKKRARKELRRSARSDAARWAARLTAMDLDDAAAEVRRLNGHQEVPFSRLKVDPDRIDARAARRKPSGRKPERPSAAHCRFWVARFGDALWRGAGRPYNRPGYGTVRGHKAGEK